MKREAGFSVHNQTGTDVKTKGHVLGEVSGEQFVIRRVSTEMDNLLVAQIKVEASPRYKKEKGKDFQPNILKRLEALTSRSNIFFTMSDLGPKTTVKREKDKHRPETRPPITDHNQTRPSFNPRSSYDTPLGIYTYPLDQTHLRQLIDKTLPYRADAPYAYVFQVNEDHAHRLLDIGSYTESQLKEDVKKLQSLYPKTTEIQEEAFKSAKKVTNMNASKLWNLTRLLANKNMKLWSKIMVSIGYIGARDPGYGLIHENEPTQSVFFAHAIAQGTKNYLKLLEVVDNEKLRWLGSGEVKSKEGLLERLKKIPVGKIPTKYLPKMMGDKDWYVRWEVAQRIHEKYLQKMMGDEDPSVRQEVAERISIDHLPKMMGDEDPSVRQEVAKRISIEHLPKMMGDRNWGVRGEVAKRISIEHLPKMMGDEDLSVRGEVAKRISIEHLPKMMGDEDLSVRWEVAKRISIEHLPKMMGDEDLSVRWEVAKRIHEKYLPKMLGDKDPDVRWEVAKRISIEHLPKMMGDEDLSVRWEVARRISIDHLPKMMDDKDSGVRQEVERRLKEHEESQKKEGAVVKLEALPKWKEKGLSENPVPQGQKDVAQYVDKPFMFFHMSTIGPKNERKTERTLLKREYEPGHEETKKKSKGMGTTKTVDQIKRTEPKPPVHSPDDKLGIYPHTTYGTPVGVYGYPLSKEMFEHLYDTKLPFKANAPFIHVFQVKPEYQSRMLVTSKYTEEDLSRDLQKLIDMFLDASFPAYIARDMYAIDRKLFRGSNYTASQARKAVGFRKHKEGYLKQLQTGYHRYTGKTDKWYRDEYETVIPTPEEAEQLWEEELQRQTKSLLRWFEKFISKAKPAPKKNPVSRLWAVTRGVANKQTAIWSKLLVALGYAGAYDDTGIGFIHRNEPKQCAVWLPKAIERKTAVDRVSNRDQTLKGKLSQFKSGTPEQRWKIIEGLTYHSSGSIDHIKHTEEGIDPFIALMTDTELLKCYRKALGTLQNAEPDYTSKEGDDLNEGKPKEYLIWKYAWTALQYVGAPAAKRLVSKDKRYALKLLKLLLPAFTAGTTKNLDRLPLPEMIEAVRAAEDSISPVLRKALLGLDIPLVNKALADETSKGHLLGKVKSEVSSFVQDAVEHIKPSHHMHTFGITSALELLARKTTLKQYMTVCRTLVEKLVAEANKYQTRSYEKDNPDYRNGSRQDTLKQAAGEIALSVAARMFAGESKPDVDTFEKFRAALPTVNYKTTQGVVTSEVGGYWRVSDYLTLEQMRSLLPVLPDSWLRRHISNEIAEDKKNRKRKNPKKHSYGWKQKSFLETVETKTAAPVYTETLTHDRYRSFFERLKRPVQKKWLCCTKPSKRYTSSGRPVWLSIFTYELLSDGHKGEQRQIARIVSRGEDKPDRIYIGGRKMKVCPIPGALPDTDELKSKLEELRDEA